MKTKGVCHLIGICLALLMTGPALARILIATSGFEDGVTRPVTIAILPPDASVSTQRLIRSESLVDESTEFSEIYVNLVATALRAKGYEVEAIDSERINNDPRLQEAVIDAKRRNADVLTTLKQKEIERREYEGSEEARILARYLDVDAIGFAVLSIAGATGGKKAMGLILGGSTGVSFGSMSLVDGRSGYLEVRFSGRGSGSAKKFEEDPEAEISEIVEEMLKKLPDADPSARVEQTSSDDDVLSDIESLLDE